jgi:hypothetical protein
MPETRGFVQQVNIEEASGAACFHVGPNMVDTEILTIQPSGSEALAAVRRSMVHAMCVALVAHHEVVAIHGDTDGRITSLELAAG